MAFQYTYKGKAYPSPWPLPADNFVPGSTQMGTVFGNQNVVSGELKYDPENSPWGAAFKAPFTPDPSNPSWLESAKKGANFAAENIPFTPQYIGTKVSGASQNVKDIGNAVGGFAAPVGDSIGDWLSKSPAEVTSSKAGRKQISAAMTDLAKPQSADIGQYFQMASQQTGVPTSYLKSTIGAESGGQANARNPNSSAGGAGQFVDQTWLHLVKQYGPKYGLAVYSDQIQPDKSGKLNIQDQNVRQRVLGLKDDKQVAILMTAELAKENKAALSGTLGRDPSDGEVYLAHFAGPAGAAQILSAPPNTPAAALQPAFAKANPQIYYKQDGTPRTTGEIANLFEGKVDENSMRWSGGKLTPPPSLAAPPQMEAAVPVDYSGVRNLISQMRPTADDQEKLAAEEKDLLYEGLASGLTDARLGIPGMMAAMAAGGFKGKAAGAALERERGDRYQELMRQFLGTQASEAGQEAQGAASVENRNREIRYQNKATGYDVGSKNAERQWQYGNDVLGRAPQVQSLGGGAVAVTHMDGDRPVVEVQDLSQLMPGLRQYGSMLGGLAGGSLTGSGSSLPEPLKKRVGAFQAAQVMGPYAGFAALADEILDSPYAGQFVVQGKPYNKIMLEAKQTAAKAGLTGPMDVKDKAAGIIAADLIQMAQQDPQAFQQELDNYQKHGIFTAQMMLHHALQ